MSADTKYTVGVGGSYLLIMLGGRATIAARDSKQPRARENMQTLVDKANAYDTLVAALTRVANFDAHDGDELARIASAALRKVLA